MPNEIRRPDALGASSEPLSPRTNDVLAEICRVITRNLPGAATGLGLAVAYGYGARGGQRHPGRQLGAAAGRGRRLREGRRAHRDPARGRCRAHCRRPTGRGESHRAGAVVLDPGRGRRAAGGPFGDGTAGPRGTPGGALPVHRGVPGGCPVLAKPFTLAALASFGPLSAPEAG